MAAKMPYIFLQAAAVETALVIMLYYLNYSAVLIVVINIISIVNVGVFGYRSKGAGSGLFLAILLGVCVLFVGVFLSLVANNLAYGEDAEYSFGLLFSTVLFSPIYGVGSLIGYLVARKKNKK